MGRPKSLIDTATVERAGKAHNCQSTDAHRLQKGEVRLTVKAEGRTAHYCRECALKIIERDLEILSRLRADLKQPT